MPEINIQLNPSVTAEAVCNLRESVGWSGLEADYPAAFEGYWAVVGAFDGAGSLVGWCAILSDGVRHAVLLDVIVHPARQSQGIGKRIVREAVDYCLSRGVTIIHVDFEAQKTGFYEACGFRIGLGAIFEA